MSAEMSRPVYEPRCAICGLELDVDEGLLGERICGACERDQENEDHDRAERELELDDAEARAAIAHATIAPVKIDPVAMARAFIEKSADPSFRCRPTTALRRHDISAAGAGDVELTDIGETLGPCPSCTATIAIGLARDHETNRTRRVLVHPVPFCTYFGKTDPETLTSEMLRRAEVSGQIGTA